MGKDECIFNESVETHLSGPYVRNIYLKKAAEEFERKNISKSVVHQINAMCINFHNTFLRDSRHHSLDQSITDDSAGNFIEENSLLKFAKQNFPQHKSKILELSTSRIKYEDQDVLRICSQLPEEWTIIQLCKAYNPSNTFLFESEILTQNCPVYLTLLNHPRSKKWKDPCCIKIEMPEDVNIFEEFYQLAKDFHGKYNFDKMDTKKNRAEYWSGMKALNDHVKTIIEQMKRTFEPYAFLFAGQSVVTEDEEDLFMKVDEFCEKVGLSNDQNIFLSMLARRVHILEDRNIESALGVIGKLGNASSESVETKLKDFVKELKNMKIENMRFKPCILIVDELIDHFFWEMVVPEQEICRVSSLRILESLYETYKHKINDGYIKMKVNSGNFFLNPDQTLPKMENRMYDFFEYWLPDWKYVAGKTPTEDQLNALLTTGEVYVYCGHGSSLQYLNGHKVAKLVTNSVAFLFGCDSIRLKSEGWHSELTGSHLYFHAALCPAVVGSLIIALDYQMDNMSTRILSSWLRSNREVHWNNMDKQPWRKGEVLTKTLKVVGNQNHYEPSLPRILSNLRCDHAEAYYNKTCFVHRGLPVWNTSVE